MESGSRKAQEPAATKKPPAQRPPPPPRLWPSTLFTPSGNLNPTFLSHLTAALATCPHPPPTYAAVLTIPAQFCSQHLRSVGEAGVVKVVGEAGGEMDSVEERVGERGIAEKVFKQRLADLQNIYPRPTNFAETVKTFQANIKTIQAHRRQLNTRLSTLVTQLMRHRSALDNFAEINEMAGRDMMREGSCSTVGAEKLLIADMERVLSSRIGHVLSGTPFWGSVARGWGTVIRDLYVLHGVGDLPDWVIDLESETATRMPMEGGAMANINASQMESTDMDSRMGDEESGNGSGSAKIIEMNLQQNEAIRKRKRDEENDKSQEEPSLGSGTSLKASRHRRRRNKQAIVAVQIGNDVQPAARSIEKISSTKNLLGSNVTTPSKTTTGPEKTPLSISDTPPRKTHKPKANLTQLSSHTTTCSPPTSKLRSITQMTATTPLTTKTTRSDFPASSQLFPPSQPTQSSFGAGNFPYTQFIPAGGRIVLPEPSCTPASVEKGRTVDDSLRASQESWTTTTTTSGEGESGRSRASPAFLLSSATVIKQFVQSGNASPPSSPRQSTGSAAPHIPPSRPQPVSPSPKPVSKCTPQQEQQQPPQPGKNRVAWFALPKSRRQSRKSTASSSSDNDESDHTSSNTTSHNSTDAYIMTCTPMEVHSARIDQTMGLTQIGGSGDCGGADRGAVLMSSMVEEVMVLTGISGIEPVRGEERDNSILPALSGDEDGASGIMAQKAQQAVGSLETERDEGSQGDNHPGRVPKPQTPNQPKNLSLTPSPSPSLEHQENPQSEAHTNKAQNSSDSAAEQTSEESVLSRELYSVNPRSQYPPQEALTSSKSIPDEGPLANFYSQSPPQSPRRTTTTIPQQDVNEETRQITASGLVPMELCSFEDDVGGMAGVDKVSNFIDLSPPTPPSPAAEIEGSRPKSVSAPNTGLSFTKMIRNAPQFVRRALSDLTKSGCAAGIVAGGEEQQQQQPGTTPSSRSLSVPATLAPKELRNQGPKIAMVPRQVRVVAGHKARQEDDPMEISSGPKSTPPKSRKAQRSAASSPPDPFEETPSSAPSTPSNRRRRHRGRRKPTPHPPSSPSSSFSTTILTLPGPTSTPSFIINDQSGISEFLDLSQQSNVSK
ncbi:hypothetical protein DFS34DRAFT_698670 [Phlyctochytrium arcticum]|nr:hypothetical protein DFS34DRAFT_698670 [Phlyctochytrium arcticum]